MCLSILCNPGRAVVVAALAVVMSAAAFGEDPPVPDEPLKIEFNFKGASYDAVLDFFSRSTGLPIVKEVEPPEGTVDYLYPKAYELDEALETLNILLQARGQMLRVDEDRLYLQKMEDIKRDNIPTYLGTVDDGVTSDRIVTVVRPLVNIPATTVAEQLKDLVGTYGSITAMQQQNQLIIVETAAQIRRLERIISELDREDVENVIEFIKLKHTQASVLLESLKSLLGERVVEYVIDQKGKKKKIEEDKVTGLNITADDRTNALIARGTRPKIDKLLEAVALLDVPSSATGRAMRTIVLNVMTPGEAAARLEQVYAKLEEPKRPTVLPLEEVGKVTIIGANELIEEGVTVLEEIDGAAEPDVSDAARTIAVVPLDHADPAAALTAIKALLNPRQSRAITLLAGPDGRSLVLSGPTADVESVRAVLEAVDQPSRVDRQVRLVRLETTDPAATIARARALYDRQADLTDATLAIEIELDAATRTATLVGSARAIDLFTGSLRMVETNTVVQRETRQVQVANARPSVLVMNLQGLADQLLRPRDGAPYTAPAFEAIDTLDTLIVTATPEQFATIDPLVRTLDRPQASDFQFHVVPITVEDVPALLEKSRFVYERLAIGLDPEDAEAPEVEHDAVTGNLLLTGRTESVARFERAIAEARQLLPADRTGRMIGVNQAEAADVRAALLELLEKTETAGAARRLTPPEIEVIERTNSLYVVAEPVQHEVIERFVQELDRYEPGDLPPLRLIQVRAADAVQLSTLLRQRYQSRSPEARREQPVEVSADAATNTLIVTAHEDLFEEIKAFVGDINVADTARAAKETMIFPLKLARATDLATALDKLYPPPPVPLDRRGRPMPHLQEPKEVYVSADAATNTLIVEAPAERRASFEALVEQLDRVELPPTAELRTYHIERGEPGQIARTLTDLARQGVMSLQPADGGKAVEVSFQAEPVSRTLIVAGDTVTFAKTEQVLTDLQAVPIRRDLRIFEVTGVDPETIASQAQRLYDEQTMGMPDATAVSVEVNAENGTLLVVAEPDAMLQFAAIFNQLQDSIAPPPDVRLISLDYAVPKDVVTFLEGLAEGTMAFGGDIGGRPPAFLSIDRTSSVLVAAQPQQHEVIRSLVESVDVLEEKEMPPLRILQLRSSDAANLAVAMTRHYAQRPPDERASQPVTITADAATNALMVAAHPDVLPEIQAIVTELNDADRLDYEGREIRIFPLRVARAEELARTIDEMFPEPPMPRDSRGRPRPDLQKSREVVVRADPQTNALIVDAPIQRMPGFEKLVEQLDRQKIVEETEIRTYRVVHADLDRLAQTLRELAAAGSLSDGEDRRSQITIATEPLTQTLIVSGPSNIFDQIGEVMTELDVRRALPTTSLRFFKLEFARADSLAAMLREVLTARLREDVPDAGADVEALLNVTADRKTNTLIISAPEAIMPLAEQLVEQLDAGAAAVGDPTIRVRPLTFADASEVSSSLSSALPNMISKTTGEPIEVRLIPSPGSNAIILVGLESDLTEVESLIEPLDARPAMDAMDARTFDLEFAEATDVAPVVERLLADQQDMDPRLIMERIRRSRGQFDPTPRVRVEADERTNSLIVSGPQQTVALAEALIKQLDRPDVTASLTYATFTPVNADPQGLIPAVQRIVDSTVAAGRRSTLELVAEPISGAIVVIGTAEETEQATTLLKQWDDEAMTAPQMDLRIVTLEHSAADTVSQAISDLLRDESRWPAKLRAIARAGITIGQPNVIADPGANRVLITAPTELMGVAADLVAQLDQPRGDDGTVDVRIFNLTQADAAAVATAVTSAMEARRRNRPGLAVPSITAEPSGNSIVVAATPAQLEEIAAMIEPLDRGVATDQPQVRTVFLEYARAENVAPIVESLLADESLLDPNQLPSWARVDYMMRQGETEPGIRVAADARLNAVVLSATPAQLAIAEEMVRQLDVDPTAVAGATGRDLRVLPVENADPEALAESLAALFAEGDLDEAMPTIRVDTASNTLLVRATADQFETIERLVEEIDRVTISATRQMRMIPVDPGKASASEMAELLDRMLQRRGASTVEVITVDELRKRREGDAADPAPAADTTSMAPPRPLVIQVATMVWAAIDPATIKAMMKAREAQADETPAILELPALGIPGESPAAPELPAEPEAVPAEPEVVPAETPSEILLGALSDDADVTIAVDEATNSLIVIGSPRQVDRIADLVQQAQDQLPSQPTTVRYIGLPDGVAARSIAQLVTQTLRQVAPPGGERGDITRRSAVLADDANNALVVAANAADFETIADLVTAMSTSPSVDEIVVKVYPLRTITAERAVGSVEALLRADDSRDRRGRRETSERMRDLAIRLLAEDETIEAVFDPNRVRVSSDLQTNSMIVMGPAEAIDFVDRFVAYIDQSPVNVQTTLRLFQLRHARADDLRTTLRNIFRSRHQSMRNQPQSVIQPEFSTDERTNTLLVTAAPEHLQEVESLLEQLDRDLGEERFALTVVPLAHAQPEEAAKVLDKVVIGNDQDRRTATLIVPNDASGVLLVRAADDVRAEIDEVLAEIDREATSVFKVRTIELERANASAVAESLQKFYDDRAKIASSGRNRRQAARRISIVGDANTSLVLVAASDDDFKEVEALIAQLDSEQVAKQLEFRVVPLRHAKAPDIEDTVRDLVEDLTWNQGPFIWGWGGGSSNQDDSGKLAVRADGRLNALILTGEGDKFDIAEKIISALDAPTSDGDRRIVRIYPVRFGEINFVARLIEETFSSSTSRRRWWEPPDPTEVQVTADEKTGSLVVVASGREHEEIKAMLASIASEIDRPDHEIVVLPVEFAEAGEVSRTITNFLNDRARAVNDPDPGAVVSASRSTNTLLVSAAPDDLAMIRDLLARIDEPNLAGDRVIEIVVLDDGDAAEIARLVSDQFAGQAGKGVRVTPDVRTNSLIVNAPKLQYERALALIERLDSPGASDETIIRTYTLTGARARDVVDILSQTLQLDSRGRTEGITIRLEDTDAEPVEVTARVVADNRSNSVIVTATEESFPIIESLIRKVDEVPAASPTEIRLIPLDHVLASDVYWTLSDFLRGRNEPGGDPAPNVDYSRTENQLIVSATADQFELIDSLLEEIDRPSTSPRVTDFVRLEFAEASKIQEALSYFYGPYALAAETPGQERTRIVADEATNSLVISADESEWENIRELLRKLDSEEYDASLQLRVLPLTYADARSVARAINDAFQAGPAASRRGDRRPEPPRSTQPGEGDRRDQQPTTLVEAEEWVRASAEPQTNSVIVSASLRSLRKIEQIVEQLDVADYATLPPPRMIPVKSGSPEQLAESLRSLFVSSDDARGRKSLRIVGDPSSNAVLVRAEDDEFQQIAALADALQQEATTQGLSVHVLRLETAPVTRVADAITSAFSAKAEQESQPLSIQVDAVSNALIIASTAALFREIEATVEQLDELAPAAGQGIFIIELEHISPDVASEVIRTIGLDRPQTNDSTSRLVVEPVRVAPLQGRNAIIVVANPVDQDTIVGLVKALDAEPKLAEARVRILTLRNAEAEAVASVIERMLTPGDQQARTPLAEAVQEQVRRLSVRRNGANQPDLNLDLTQPIRVHADPNLNAVIVSSTPENVAALEEVVAMLDELPLTDAVVVQIFPLENIAADQFQRIVADLFSQGKNLANVPGTELSGVPGGTVGRALLDEVAMAIDERTNTVIVAGKEDAVAFVEVLREKIDSEIATGWVEPRIITLRYADAGDLAETLQEIIVDGADGLPQSAPMQRQVGRLRMAINGDPGDPKLESEVFQPMTRLLIRPEPQLNALVVVGTPVNLEVVDQLVAMLDVEAASPSAAVRIYPVVHASASRLADTITRLFDQQVDSKAIRPEDRVIVQADERTNALVVTTSPRSFVVLEGLLDSLDAEIAPDLREIRRIKIENASATRLATLIQELMDARLERLRKVQPDTADLERATIVADPRTNSLVVAAGNDSFGVVSQLATDLDTDRDEDESLVRVLDVDGANIDRLADTINAIMERRYAEMPSELRASQVPLVMTDARSNSLMIAANPEDYAAIEELVKRLGEVPVDPAVDLTLITVDGARAEELAPRLQTLMRDRMETLGDARTPADRVRIEADLASNSLLVSANDENVEVIRGLIKVLTNARVGAVGGRDVEVVNVTTSRASEIAALVEEMYVEEENRLRGDNTVRVSADDRLNAVLINAPEHDVTALKRLISQLDGARPASVVEIKYIALNSANAVETVSLIEDVLSGRNVGGRRASEQATVLKYFHEIADDVPGAAPGGEPMSEMEVSAAIRETISLTPDLRTNTIIVSAPSESMTMIERMIADLDNATTGTKKLRIFKLENADAEAMARILTDLFQLDIDRTLNVLKPRERGGDDPLTDDGMLSTELTTVPDERQQLSITVDSRTNTLLVSGAPTYLDLVEEVVSELDSQEANERETIIYPLKNAVAADVARVIGDFVSQDQQKLIETIGFEELGSAGRLLEREVTIVGDDKSNTVLVTTSPRYMERIKTIIDELDIDPPQVLIEVLIAEITLDAGDDWGVDAEFRFNLDGTDITGGYGLAAGPVLGTMGVPSLAIAATDFDLMIKALQSQGRLALLSNPSIMAANNETARIQVGQTIRVASATSFDQGSQSTATEEEDIGVILEVTPSINPEGFVRMDIVPTISALTQQTIQINEDFETPIITIRTADTTVTVQDGQTIVLGGLIQDRYERREEKVPLLGDIPLLGELFKSHSERSESTELIIVLTPHVVMSPAAIGRQYADDLTNRQVDALHLPESIRENIREGSLIGSDGLFDAQGNPIDIRTKYDERVEESEADDDDGAGDS